MEAIDPDVWNTVQLHLKEWVDSPAAVASSEPGALQRLTNGLMMTGFAMQAHKTSRPASGADHQFSHLWDMQHHTHEGVAPSHGFKVGIGTVASLALYEELLSRDLAKLDIEDAVSRWPSLEQLNSQIGELLGDGELGMTALKETSGEVYWSRGIAGAVGAVAGRLAGVAAEAGETGDSGRQVEADASRGGVSV